MNHSENLNSSNIDLFSLILLFWKNKFFIIFLTTIFGISSIFIALSLHPIYASTIVLKSVQENNTGAAMSLGVLSGINNLKGSLGLNPDEEAILAIKHAHSKDFFKVLYNYEGFKKNLLAYKSYNPDKKSNNYDEKIYSTEANKWLYNAHFLTAHKKFTTEHITISQDKIGDFVEITIEHQSPIIAAEWANLVFKELNTYMKIITLETTQAAVDYMMIQIKNTDSTELKKVLSSTIESKIQKLMYAEISDDYIFSIVDSAYVPIERVRPSRAFICIMITMLGLLISLFIVFILDIFNKRILFFDMR